ncbi:hypothetical protein MKW92_002189 [Papaver armeniacum]|nr:hypothetical protein MKW92_002189 [Papaver armeniacum]
MQVYGDPKSWTKSYTVTHEIITSRIRSYGIVMKFMWSFKNGVILFTDTVELYLYDPQHGRAIICKLSYLSVENYSESLVSLNSGTYVGGRTANSSYTELQELGSRKRITELEARNAELQTKLHESQVAQKEVEESKKDDVEETAITKKIGRKRKAGKRKEEHQYNTRRASKAVPAMLSSPGESTNFHDESVTMQQRAEKEQAKPVLLPTGCTLEPYQIKEGSKTHSASKDTYQTLTVKTLRGLLKERGLMVKGKKDELIARLRGI